LVSLLPGARVGRIGGTAFSFLYLAFRALLAALVRSRRGLDVKTLSYLCCGTSLRFCAARLYRLSSRCLIEHCWPLRPYICRARREPCSW
jgi:hypothetical protein